MSTELLEQLLQMKREGKSLIGTPAPPPTLSKEEAAARLRLRPITLYYGGPSGKGMRDACYEFDLSQNTWKKTLDAFPLSPESGEIPPELAERFLDAAWPVCNLDPAEIYKTDSKRRVPADEEERYILQSDTKRLTWFRALLNGTVFEWIAETDTGDPYGLLTRAFTELLTGLEI